MPIKDDAERRAYFRDYMRRRRAGEPMSAAETKIGQQNLRSVLLMNSAASIKAAAYEGPVDDKIIEACQRAANAWSELAERVKAEAKPKPEQPAFNEAEALERIRALHDEEVRERARWGGRPRVRVVGDIERLLAGKGLADPVMETIVNAMLPHVAEQAHIERGIPRRTYRKVWGDLHTHGKAADTDAFIAFRELDVRKDGKRNWKCIVIADDKVVTMADLDSQQERQRAERSARAKAAAAKRKAAQQQ
jgi:hypothetical protein